ncbi:unnamed protein product [Effrenium voratum]|nr:unnamed protein product [Effrenium voratum]|mmetsp:Transcript_96837/g.230408  ORF Transcript_96837/g.230408 Transcript_96837/m.230408 type:complete len:114 (-) Transcript_96837:57-398(-)
MARRHAAVLLSLIACWGTAFIPQVRPTHSAISVVALGSPAWAVTAGFEDYNQLNVKAAKKVVEAAPTTPDDGPSEAVSVIGGAGFFILIALFIFGVAIVVGKRDPNMRDGERI